MTRQELLTLDGEFTYCWGCLFFIKTEKGNFVWLDSEYPGGDNSITPFKGTYEDFLKENEIQFGRNKGFHNIEKYCGSDVKFNEQTK